jgi:hypothetical protein
VFQRLKPNTCLNSLENLNDKQLKYALYNFIITVYGNGKQAVLMVYRTALRATLTVYGNGNYPFMEMVGASSSRN